MLVWFRQINILFSIFVVPVISGIFGFAYAGDKPSLCLTESKLSQASTGWVRHEKIRMGWSPSIDQFEHMAKAGMNAVMPRLELDAVIKYESKNAATPISKTDAYAVEQLVKGSQRARQLGMRYFHSLDLAAESQVYQIGLKGNQARFNDGELPSPVDPIYWRRAILQRVQRMLDLLDDNSKYALDGVIIDPEMYALSAAVPGDPDYGLYAFAAFMKDIKREVPAGVKDVAARKEWLIKKKLYERYIQWQFDRIASMARELRELVHSRRPEAILGFIIYKDKLWFNAMAKGLATKSLPVFIGPESTYSGVMDSSFIQYVQAIRKSVAVPCFVVPGIRMGFEDGKIPHKLLTVLEGNVYRRCMYSDGYWVWAIYRFGKDQQERDVFYQAIKRINIGLDNFAKTKQPDPALKANPLPVDLPANFTQILQMATNAKPVPSKFLQPKSLPFKSPQLRGTHILAMWPEKSENSTFKVRTVKIGNYLDQGDVRIFDKNGKLLWQDSILANESKVFRLPQSVDNVYIVAVSAGKNAYRIENVDSDCALIDTQGVSINAEGDGGTFFFFVPEGQDRVCLKLKGHPIETANYILSDSEGSIVKSWTKLRVSKSYTVPVKKPGIWKLEVKNVVDDAGFELINLPNMFSFRPQDVRTIDVKSVP